jgi:hypothetical protein
MAVTKYDSNWVQEWTNTYGGSGNETMPSLQQTTDGGFIVSATSRSSDGDVPGNNGLDDVWLFKLDREGNLQTTDEAI